MTPEAAREILLGHARSDRNGRLPADATHTARLVNPRCGDQVEMAVTVKDGLVEAAGFSARACAICTASSSMLAKTMPGLGMPEILRRGDLFEAALVEEETREWPSALADLASLAHLRVNPSRRACAILPWIAVRKIAAALNPGNPLPTPPNAP